MTTMETLARFKAERGRFVRRLAGVRAVWLALALFAALYATDAGFALSDSARAVSMMLLVIASITIGVSTVLLARRSRSIDRMVARLVEESEPKLGNTLVNALDFEEKLRTSEADSGAEFMRREIATADHYAQRIQSLEMLRPQTYRRERLILIVAAIVVIVGAIGLYRVSAAVLPRLFFPFGDFPPYSATAFAVVPGAAKLDYGQDLKVTISTSGRIPAALSLVVWDPQRGEIGALPMFNSARGEFFQTIENVHDDIRYFARAGNARSKRFLVTVLKIPKLDSVVVDYEYPAYTRKAHETRTLSDGIVKGYAGTRVELTVRSNRPLKSGGVSAAGTAVDLAARDDRTVRGVVTLAKTGPLSISIKDVDGNEAVDAAKGRIEIIPDEAPVITITAPGMDSFAVPDAKVPIEITTTDDLGIAQVALFRNHNQSKDARKVVYEADDGRGTLTVTETLDLASLGVRPGDMMEYYATARDNMPDTPHSAATPAFRLQIVSQEEYRDYMQTQMTATDLKEQYDALLEAMQALAEQQKQTVAQTEALQSKMAQGQPSADDLKQLEQIQQQQQQLEAAAGAAADRLRKEAAEPSIFDIENSYKEALKDFAKRLEEAKVHMGNAKQQMTPPGSGVPGAISEQREALAKLGEVTGDFQKGIQKAGQHLENVMGVLGDVENFKYLYTLQKGLERQIRYYKEKANPTLDEQIRLKELSAQERDVLEALSGLKKSFRDHADSLDELTKKQAAEKQSP